jgi:gamma-glutamyltranspeptidase/glutathione hydrolase
MRYLTLFPALLFASSAAVAQERPTVQTRVSLRPAVAIHGMVSSAHPLATEAGLAILEAGGNAFDAAVTVAATLNVVEPMMSGVGGYGTILVYSAKDGRSWFVNPSGRIPKDLNSDAFRPPTPDYRANRVGAKSVSTPGNANAWESMWKRYGSVEWRRLLEPAIALAKNGFALDSATAAMIASAFPTFSSYTQAFYGRNGAPLEAGDTLIQRDLGRSLELIATEGAHAVHGGELGHAIDAAMRAAGGFLSLEDLEANRTEWWDPITIPYRGYTLVTASPPANSWPALLRLGLMSRYDVQTLGHNSVAYLHRYAEVTKHAFWARLRWAGDPEVAAPPLDVLLSPTYWDGIVAQIDPDRARAFVPPTAFGTQHTTHFVVADQWGNVVSATQTLGNLFGSRIMPEGTGIWLNNSLAYSTFEPTGNPMDAFPGRHKLSGDVPLFVERDGHVWIAIGTPGGHTIAQTVPQMVMNAVDFGMDIQTAIAAPRIAFTEPDLIAVEDAIPDSIRRGLEARGHRIRVVRALGNAHGLTIEYGPNGQPIRFTGGSDPRGRGLAKGY